MLSDCTKISFLLFLNFFTFTFSVVEKTKTVCKPISGEEVNNEDSDVLFCFKDIRI